MNSGVTLDQSLVIKMLGGESHTQEERKAKNLFDKEKITVRQHGKEMEMERRSLQKFGSHKTRNSVSSHQIREPALDSLASLA